MDHWSQFLNGDKHNLGNAWSWNCDGLIRSQSFNLQQIARHENSTHKSQ